MIRFIGDIHAHWAGYATVIANVDYTFQVGDFGMGFPGYDFPEFMLKTPGVHRFIRGNHDDPAACKKHPWYLGDYGYLAEFGDYKGGIGYIGGAWTPDFYKRTEGIDWWNDEELEYRALDKAIFMVEALRPKILVTHDCPRELKKKYLGRNRYLDNNGDRFRDTRTDNALQVLFERHQPDIWIFGHYHYRFDDRINGTRFICLEKFGVLDIE